MTKNSTQEEKKKEVFSKLKELENSYQKETGGKVEKPLQLERLTYSRPDDEELYEKAKASVAEKYAQKRASALSDAEKKKQSFSSQISDIESQLEKDNSSLDSAYSSATDKINADVMKRGIQRSSIASGKIAELEEGKLADKLSLNLSSKQKADKIRAQIDALSLELDEVLKKADEDELSESQTKFEELKKESDEKSDAVKKYNNTLEEKEVKYNSSASKTPSDEQLEKIKKTYDIKKVGTILDYYLSFDNKSEAVEDFLSEPAFEDYLGDYYSYVFTVLKNRAN